MVYNLGWVIFFIIAWLTALILVPIEEWYSLWPSGLIGMSIIYIIDTALITLGAFKYSFGNKVLGDIPVFYWLSSFPGGVLLVYYYTVIDRWLHFPYILLASAIFLAMEYIMIKLGYFHHLKWKISKSFVLNIIGFSVVISLVQWFGVI